MLPKLACQWRILPGLSHHSLLSIVQLCEAGCLVLFKHDCCLVLYQGRIVRYGIKCPNTNLWFVPLKVTEKMQQPANILQLTSHQLNSIYDTKTQTELITHLHQCLFSPSKATLMKAIQNDWPLGIPQLKEKLVHKHLPPSTAIGKDMYILIFRLVCL